MENTEYGPRSFTYAYILHCKKKKKSLDQSNAVLWYITGKNNKGIIRMKRENVGLFCSELHCSLAMYSVVKRKDYIWLRDRMGFFACQAITGNSPLLHRVGKFPHFNSTMILKRGVERRGGVVSDKDYCQHDWGMVSWAWKGSEIRKEWVLLSREHWSLWGPTVAPD